jgi:hypothetical protein
MFLFVASWSFLLMVCGGENDPGGSLRFGSTSTVETTLLGRLCAIDEEREAVPEGRGATT